MAGNNRPVSHAPARLRVRLFLEFSVLGCAGLAPSEMAAGQGRTRIPIDVRLFALICGREKRRVFSLWWVADTRDGSGQCVAGVPVFQGVPKANRDRTKLKENEGGPCQV
jgi:hypothetical protein